MDRSEKETKEGEIGGKKRDSFRKKEEENICMPLRILGAKS